jgi:hypothetical protein
MFFNKSSKQAFVFPPKVGTISARHFLGSIGWKGLQPYHGTTDYWFEKYPALNDYAVYGFLRDPIQRFESAFLHVKQFPTSQEILAKLLIENGIKKTIEAVTFEDLIGIHEKLVDKFKVLFSPQAKWLDHPKVTVLDFCNIESELRRITGNTTQDFKRWNVSSDFGRSVITPAVEEFVRQKYAKDYFLLSALDKKSALGAKE